MASKIRDCRKRKAASDLVFEVDEGDFSPSETPDPPPEEIITKLDNDSDVSEIIDLKLECKQTENVTMGQGDGIFIDNSKSDDVDTSLSIIDASETNKNIEVRETSITDIDNPKSDDDLRCMDMEVANSPSGAINIEKPVVNVIFRDKDIACRVGERIKIYIQSILYNEYYKNTKAINSDTAIQFWDEEEVELIKEEKSDLFVVDTTPSRQREYLPRYTPKNNCTTLGEPEKTFEVDTRCRPTQTCFNCDGDHAIRDCKEARNSRKIALARNRFRANQQQKAIRYHVEDDIKYKHLKPGRISDELRRALDVRKGELPPYIYRMRVLGYPPGWLQEAMITNTKLELFDFDGCSVNDEAENLKKIDSTKVVEYPGFNAPLEKGYKDEYKYFNCPPYNEKHSKTCMVEYIEQTAEQTVIKNHNPPKKVVESDSNSQESQEEKRSESPSLIDLELRKKQLLAELDDGSDVNSPQPEKDIKPQNVVKSSFGTPILESASPYKKLPDGDNFSKGVCPVINFENLPDSTGKYEQMSAVISKVRETVKNSKSS